jgi:3-hydroxyisobutyrate dehydrogenase
MANYKKIQTVGFVGIGVMGSRMIQNLKGSVDLLVYDVDHERANLVAREASAIAVPSLSGLAKAEAIIMMLPNSNIVDAVVMGSANEPGLIDILEKDAMIIDMSSSTPSNTIENAKQCAKKGIHYIDAPVSGGPTGAAAGTLAIMVGGTQSDFDHAKPLLEKLGGNVLLIGDIGSGHAVKSLNNLLCATVLAATAEIFAAGEKFGLDPKIMQQIINTSSGGSFATNLTYPKAVLPKSWDFGFAIGLMNKDIGIAMSLINSTGVETVLNRQASEMWTKTMEASGPASDMTEIVRQIYQRVGL